jgi:hypothetical protein
MHHKTRPHGEIPRTGCRSGAQERLSGVPWTKPPANFAREFLCARHTAALGENDDAHLASRSGIAGACQAGLASW